MSEVTDYIGVLTHTFRKVGAVAISGGDAAAYYNSPLALTGSCIGDVGALLTLADKAGILIWAPPGVAASGQQGLYVAECDKLLRAIEADRAAAEEEAADRGEEKVKVTDLPIDERNATFVSTAGVYRAKEMAIWHLAAHPSGDFVLVCTSTHIHIHPTVHLLKGSAAGGVSLEMDQTCYNVIWNQNEKTLELGVLLEDLTFRVYELDVVKGQMQCTQAYGAQPVHAIASTPEGWIVGHRDGSMTQLNEASFEDNPLLIQAPALPASVTENGKPDLPFGVHSLQFIEPDVLLVGFMQFDEANPPGWREPQTINIAVFNMSNGEWRHFGDVLRDEDRLRDDSASKYKARVHHRISNLPPLRLSVFSSNRAGEVTMLGCDPDTPPNQTWPVQWWMVGEAEADQIVVPMDEEFEATFNLGLVVDTTNTLSAKVASGNNEEKSEERFPAVFMLASNGRMHCYQLLTSDPAQLARLRNSVMHAPIPPVLRALNAELSRLPPEDPSGQLDGGGEAASPDPGAAQAESDDDEVSVSAVKAASPGALNVAQSPPGGPQPSPTTAFSMPNFSIPATGAAPGAAAAPFAFNLGGGDKKSSSDAPPAAFSGFSLGGEKNEKTTATAAAAPFSFSAAPAAAGDKSTAASFSTAAFSFNPGAAQPKDAARPSFDINSWKPSPSPEPAVAAGEKPTSSGAKKALQFSTDPMPAAAGSVFSTAPSSSAVQLPTAGAEKKPVVPAAAVAAPSTMTRSILKPATTAVAPSTNTQSAQPSKAAAASAAGAAPALNKFAVDYSSEASDATPGVNGVNLRELPQQLSVDPSQFKNLEGNDTEKQFLQALLTVAVGFKQMHQVTLESRQTMMAIQHPNVKVSEEQFCLRRLRRLTSRTRILIEAANKLEAQTNGSFPLIDSLILAGKRADKTAMECKTMLASHGDEEYLEMMDQMSLDVHSSRLKQSIEKSMAQLKEKTAQLEAHLQELYTQYDAHSSGRRGATPAVPTVKSVVGVLNTHGQTIVDLESQIDDLAQQVEYLQFHPSSNLKLDKDRRKRQQQLREDRLQRNALSPIERTSSLTSISTPLRQESKEESLHDSFSSIPPSQHNNNSATKFSPYGRSPSDAGRTSSQLSRTPSTFRASSLSVLSSSFQEKLKSQTSQSNGGAGGSGGKGLNRPGLNREASMIALHRGKSKQRIEQLFEQVESQGFGAVGENDEDSGALNESGEEKSSSRRWARTGPSPKAIRPAAPSAAESAENNRSSDEEEVGDDDTKPLLRMNTLDALADAQKPTTSPSFTFTQSTQEKKEEKKDALPAASAFSTAASASAKPSTTAPTFSLPAAASFGGTFGSFGSAPSQPGKEKDATASGVATAVTPLSFEKPTLTKDAPVTSAARSIVAPTMPGTFNFGAAGTKWEDAGGKKTSTATSTTAPPGVAKSTAAAVTAADVKPEKNTIAPTVVPATNASAAPAFVFGSPATAAAAGDKPKSTTPIAFNFNVGGASAGAKPATPDEKKPSAGAAAILGIKPSSAAATTNPFMGDLSFGTAPLASPASAIGPVTISVVPPTPQNKPNEATSVPIVTPTPVVAKPSSPAPAAAAVAAPVAAAPAVVPAGSAAKPAIAPFVFGASASSPFGSVVLPAAPGPVVSPSSLAPAAGMSSASSSGSRPEGAAFPLPPGIEGGERGGDEQEGEGGENDDVKTEPSSPVNGPPSDARLSAPSTPDNKGKEGSPVEADAVDALSGLGGLGGGAASGSKTTSLFGNVAAPPVSSGASAAAPLFGPGAASGSSLFGGALSGSSGLFGATPSGGLFGNAASATASTPATAAAPSGLSALNFGGAPATANPSSAGLFGNSASGGFPPSNNNAATGLFGSSGSGAALFGTGSGTATSTTPNLFSSAPGSTLFNMQPKASLFGPTATPAPAAPMTNNIFASSGSSGGMSTGAPANSATAAFQNAFGSSGGGLSTGTGSNPFASGGPQQSGGPFGGSGFGQTSQQGFGQPQAPGGPFAGGPIASSPFNQQPQSSVASAPFGQPSSNPLGAGFGRPSFGAAPGFGGGGLGMGAAPQGVAPSVAQLAYGGMMGGIGGGIGGIGGGGFGSSGASAAFGSGGRPSAPFGSGSGGGAVFGGSSSAQSGGFGALAATAPQGGFGAIGGGAPQGGGFGGFGQPQQQQQQGFPQQQGFGGGGGGGYSFDTSGIRG